MSDVIFVTILKQADIFHGFTPTQLELVANLCQEHSYRTGETIFREGTNSNELYMIAQGEVHIIVQPALPGNNNELVIATLHQGQSFGEVALVDQGLRSATARANRNPTRVLSIPRDKLIQLCDTYPQLGYRLMQNLAVDLAVKMRSTDLRIRQDLQFGHTK